MSDQPAASRGVPRLWKITPVVALATVIALLTAGGWMAHYLDRANALEEVDEDNVQARILASTITAALSFNDRQAAQEYVDALRANPRIEAAAIYDFGRQAVRRLPRRDGHCAAAHRSPQRAALRR